MRVGEKYSNTMVEYYGMWYIVVCSDCKNDSLLIRDCVTVVGTVFGF